MWFLFFSVHCYLFFWNDIVPLCCRLNKMNVYYVYNCWHCRSADYLHSSFYSRMNTLFSSLHFHFLNHLTWSHCSIQLYKKLHTSTWWNVYLLFDFTFFIFHIPTTYTFQCTKMIYKRKKKDWEWFFLPFSKSQLLCIFWWLNCIYMLAT
jgi:hypothetical protein